jgi:hypothetical protein
LSITLLVLTTLVGCSEKPAGNEAVQGVTADGEGAWQTGFEVRGVLQPSGASLTIDEAVTAVKLEIRLPAGYIAADGFQQQIAVATATGDGTTYTTDVLGDPLVIPLPADRELSLSLTLGYCAEKTKDICYVDRAVLAIVRSAGSSLEDPGTLIYRPGAHL